jgi:hypothetical protein
MSSVTPGSGPAHGNADKICGGQRSKIHMRRKRIHWSAEPIFMINHSPAEKCSWTIFHEPAWWTKTKLPRSRLMMGWAAD